MDFQDLLRKRRQKLTNLHPYALLLWSGTSQSRNFPANHYPFRSSSHFLYFAGFPLENAVLFLHGDRAGLFWDTPPAQSALWYGTVPSQEEITDRFALDFVLPLSQIDRYTSPETATIPINYLISRQEQILSRPLSLSHPNSADLALALAIVAVRSQQDEIAITEIRQAIAVTVSAHLAGMRACRSATTEAQVRAAMEAVIFAHNLQTAYQSIVTIYGEVLHNQKYHRKLHPGDLLLADVGAESLQGWAADVTRTWPISGRFSPSQRAIYQIVYEAQQACIAHIRSGVEYRDIHLRGAEVLTAGLIEVGILKGNAADLLEIDAHTLFFPHGIGHLLGLDVHDMEDLGDLAGYAPGRIRSERVGLAYLRLDRPLEAGMVVTIEPGFYQVPFILTNRQLQEKYQGIVDWQRLADFTNVRGIRIEDDILVTETGCEVLSAALPSQSKEIEAIVLS